jgi:hypothetical protein
MALPIKFIEAIQDRIPTSIPPANLYRVEGKNETLQSISKTTGLPLKDIQDLNKHIKNPKQVLTPGQEIELPSKPSKPEKKESLETQIANSKLGDQGKQALDQTTTVAGYTGKLADAADPKIAAELQKVEQRVAGLQQELPKLQKEIQGEVSKLVDLSTSGKITKDEFYQQLSKHTSKLTNLDMEIRAAEQQMQSLSQASKGTGLVKEFGKTMEKLGDVKTTLGKCAFGLDVAANFASYQDKDPSNSQYNLTKAINASASNFYLNAAMPKSSAAGAAGALVKFGLECIGKKDTPLYDSVDVATQCLPSDIISKGVVQAMDQTKSVMEIIGSGGKDWSRLQKLNDANLSGENGLVMQGASILGDLIANGGRNVPKDGTGVRLAESMGFYGHTEILGRDIGRTAEQKTALVNKLLKGSTSADDELKILNILNQSDPATLSESLKTLDRDRLIRELPNRNQAIDPAAALVIDTYLKSNQTNDSRTQEQLRILARDMVFKCQDQERTKALDDLRQRGVMAKLGIR